MADEDDIDVTGDFTNIFYPLTDVCVDNLQNSNSMCSSADQMSIAYESYKALNDVDSLQCEGNATKFSDKKALVECNMEKPIHATVSLLHTGQPTSEAQSFTSSSIQRKVNKHNTNIIAKSKQSLLKPDILKNLDRPVDSDVNIIGVDKEVLLYADAFVIGSTESVGGDYDSIDEETSTRNVGSFLMSETEKKAENHRRKHTLFSSSLSSKAQSKTKFNISVLMKNKHRSKRIKSPANAKYKNENVETAETPKLQLVFSSGQALPVSEGEQVIKIEKKKSADSESEIEIDIDSDDSIKASNSTTLKEDQIKVSNKVENKTSLIQRKFEPVRRRQTKVHLDGDGGCTIMHTESGDLIEVLPEPRKEKLSKKQPIHLLSCRMFNADKPAPYSVRLLVSALVLMDAHAHGSRAEVMGLLGGELRAGVLHLRGYRTCAAAASHTHCDMCPVSQARAAEALRASGHAVVGWHHSHPRFAAQPSLLDLRTQHSMQRALERHDAPFLALITSQHWPHGRRASTYRCFRVESEGPGVREHVGYQFSVQLVPDLTAQSVPGFLERLSEVSASHDTPDSAYCVRMASDICADAHITYLEKCLSSVSHHLTSAGYSEQDLTYKHVMRGVRDVFR